ncbi:MAG: ThuA domain-containing protein [Verrucomicrobiota bacterium]|nr:ThuA domain-containing protein [Verrucomicrobiota bacterium]
MKQEWLLIFGMILAAFALPAADAPRLVFITGDHEYSSERTMPLLAKELEKNYGMQTTVLYAAKSDGQRDEQFEENIPGLEALEKADLAIFFLRWRLLPEKQVEQIKKYLDSGKPVVGFRTTSHSFHYPKGSPLERWNAFGEFTFGTPPGWGAAGHTHYGHHSSTDVSVIPAAANHPILHGVDENFHVRSWLYHVLPKYPPPDATPLLMGKAVSPDKPAIENPVAWTYHTEKGGRAFYTSLGHPEDFQVAAFQRLVLNAIHWALGKPVPEKWRGKMEINVPYEKSK